MKGNKKCVSSGMGVVFIIFGCVIVGQQPNWLTIPVGVLLIVVGVWLVE